MRSWGLVALAAMACGQGSSQADACRVASYEKRFKEAIAPCREASGGGDPELRLLLAGALERTRAWKETVAVAEPLFGSPVDVAARQVVGAARMQLGEPAGEAMLREIIARSLAAGDDLAAARAGHVLARELLRMRRMVESLDVEQQAVEAARRSRDAQQLGLTLLGMAKIFTNLGDERQARQAVVEAAQLLGPWPREQAWVFLIHGMLLLDTGDAAGAVPLLTRANELGTRHSLQSVIDGARMNLAYAERVLGHVDAAQAWLERADPAVRAQPSGVFVEGLVAADRGDQASAERLLASAAATADDDDYASNVAYQRGRLAERRGDQAAAEKFFRDSIAIVEKIRERAQDLELRGWVLSHRRGAYGALFALLARQHRLVDALEIGERLHARTWLDSQVGAARTQASAAGHTKEERSSAVEYLATLRAVSRARSGEDLLELVGNREALVYIEEHGTLWRLSLAGRQVAELAALPSTVLDEVDAWTGAPDDAAAAERLGAALLPSSLKASREPLYIVAGGPLAALPFAALRRSGRALIEDRPLIRLPGLAAFQCSPRPAATGASVFLGDPLGDLPSARREAERAARSLASTASVGGQATVSRLYAAADAALLHIAAHADVEAGGGVLTLADGRVTALDLLSRRIAPAVAVLAGCATGASSLPENWGSLASGFLAAGTRTVVATLRPVADTDAAALIELFYRAGGARRPALALADAQRELARTRPPHEWAAFAVWGAPEPDLCPAPAPKRRSDLAIRRDADSR